MGTPCDFQYILKKAHIFACKSCVICLHACTETQVLSTSCCARRQCRDCTGRAMLGVLLTLMKDS